MKVFNVVLDKSFGYGGGFSILIVADNLEEATELAKDIVEIHSEYNYPFIKDTEKIHAIYDKWDTELKEKGDWVAIGYYE